MRDLRTVFERARLHLGEVGGDPGHEVAKYQVAHMSVGEVNDQHYNDFIQYAVNFWVLINCEWSREVMISQTGKLGGRPIW